MDNETRNKFYEAIEKHDNKTTLSVIKEQLPLTLIKFFSGEYHNENANYNLDSLKNQKIWLSSPLQFNDPFDCRLKVDYAENAFPVMKQVTNMFFEPSCAKNILAEMKDREVELKNAMNEIFLPNSCQIAEILFVSCFSEKDNLYSMRMWAHYARSHRGFCAEYDYNIAENPHCTYWLPVRYSEQQPFTGSFENNIAFCVNTAYTKSEEWAYEKEWRFVELNKSQKNSKGHLIDFPYPKAIYMGCKIDDKLRLDLVAFCREHKVKLYRARIQLKTFTVDFVEFPLV